MRYVFTNDTFIDSHHDKLQISHRGGASVHSVDKYMYT